MKIEIDLPNEIKVQTVFTWLKDRIGAKIGVSFFVHGYQAGSFCIGGGEIYLHVEDSNGKLIQGGIKFKGESAEEIKLLDGGYTVLQHWDGKDTDTFVIIGNDVLVTEDSFEFSKNF